MILLGAAFLLIAALYASVGLGGGSAYLAVLALGNIPRAAIVPVALACNVIAAGTGAYHYWRAGHFRPRLLLPFAITSIPAAYIGSLLPLDPHLFRLILATGLLFAAARLAFASNFSPSPMSPPLKGGERNGWQAWFLALPLGAVLGLLAGLVGIGGGIFLIPTLLFLGWATPKEAAAVGAVFVVGNSVAGLTGFAGHGGAVLIPLIFPLLLAVIAGSQFGARVGARRLAPIALQRFTAAVLTVAAVNLVWRSL